MVRFSWNIIIDCNFKCSYCWFNKKWDEYKNRNIIKTPDELEKVWERIFKLYGKVKIDVLGGEPFLYPNFIEVLNRVSKYHILNVTSNLSFDVHDFIEKVQKDRFYKNMGFAFTFHPFYIDFETFLKKIEILKDFFKCRFDVIYLAWPPYTKDIPYYKKIFEERGFGFRVLTFWGKYQGKEYPMSYTEEEKKNIGLGLGERSGEKFQTEPFSPYGKLCNAGHTYGVIMPDGEVIRCGGLGGHNSKYIGNIFRDDFRLWDAPRKCTDKFCPCNEWAEFLVR